MIESIAVLFSIIYVILAARNNIWCWLFGGISVILYIYICFIAELFAETALQIFYLFMTAYGYYNWAKKNKKTNIKQWHPTKHLLCILLGSFLMFLMGFLLTIYTSSKLPLVDSFTTVFSIIATYMVAKRILENWLYWIVINIASIYLYFNRDLELTSLLFVTYTIIAIFGYFHWLKKIETDG